MDVVKTIRKPPLGWIVFCRQEVKNAFNVEMWRAVPEKALELDEDEEIKVILMRGEGNCFGAGADIKELLQYTEENRAQEYADAVNYCFRNLLKVKKVMIAVIEGYALGGGCMVAASCDLRIAERGAKIGIPLVKLGLAVEPLGIKRLMDIVGIGFASEFLLFGDVIPEEKLTTSGFINFWAEKGKAVELAEELAKRLLENGEFALLTTKKIIKQHGGYEPLDEKYLHKAFAECMRTEDFVKRAKSFLKR